MRRRDMFFRILRRLVAIVFLISLGFIFLLPSIHILEGQQVSAQVTLHDISAFLNIVAGCVCFAVALVAAIAWNQEDK